MTICNAHNLVDPWRFTHPVSKEFSWVKPDHSCRSRIDFWLISDYMKDFVAECSVSSTPIIDHSSINLTLRPTDTCKRKKGCWKFNASRSYSETVKKLNPSLKKCQTMTPFPLIHLYGNF